MGPEELILSLKWRAGRKVGRTVYAQLGAASDDRDPMIGVMDTAAFAAHIVKLHNERLADGKINDHPETKEITRA
jgi:hypothetical protein